MSLDSITKKQKPQPIGKSKSLKNFIIPLIIIIIVIAIVWFITLKYNFQRIDSQNQQEPDPAAQEINSAVENLSEEFEKLKDQKIFSQDEGQPEESESIEIPQEEPVPAQQY